MANSLDPLLILHAGFVPTSLLYGCFLRASFPDGTPVALFTALAAAHLFGRMCALENPGCTA